MSATAIMIILFFACILINIPIGFSLGISSAVAIMITDLVPISFIAKTYITAANSFTLLAVPFFILAGDLMLDGGISTRLVNLGRALFGHMTGALSIITVFACAIFAALSGSGPATVAAIGGIMIPAMVEENYDPEYASALASVSGCLGPLIPPSIIMAMYGITCSVSISDLFIIGTLPGIILALVLVVFSYFIAKKYNFGIKSERKRFKESMAAIKDAVWALLAPLIILGGIYSGFCTPTESAVIACVYALIVGVFVYKEIKWSNFIEILTRSALTSGSCLILLGGANVFGRVLALEQIPAMLVEFLGGITSNKIVLLLIITFILFITGMFMETVSAIVILGPLLLTVVEPYGVTPLHFGLIMVMNLVLGLATPPVGVNLFVASRLSKVKLEDMIKWLIPLLGLSYIVLLLFTYWTDLAMFLPNLVHSLQK